jgi:hypothetical protein
MSQSNFRPAAVCKALLAALEASEGRRRSRKRDQTPDGIGLTFKRELLEQAVRDDPEPEAFEEWLLNYSTRHDSAGGILAMARAVFEEWRLAHSMGEFKSWLEQGAPSEDANEDSSFRPRDQQPESAKGRL